MKVSKFQWGILFFNILYLLIFAMLYFGKKNFEFLIYISVIVVLMILISFLHFKYNFSNGVLIGMSIWGLLHMMGGYIIVGTDVLYGYWIFPFLRFDQFVHAIGFGSATLLSYYILKPSLNKEIKNWVSVSVLIVFIGMGIGALNEIIEFIAVILVPNTGVGGYDNTMFDMIFNTLGATIAVVYINIKESLYKKNRA
jgi:uncharacterized membrane protein YjdF